MHSVAERFLHIMVLNPVIVDSLTSNSEYIISTTVTVAHTW